MRVYFLGTCAGTEPMPGRKHASVVVECQDRLYWLDAGEGCSYTAHMLGLDLLKVADIVISHPHMDHVGGLGNLLWNIRKLRYMRDRLPVCNSTNVYIPSQESWDGLMMFLSNTESGFKTDYPINMTLLREGVLVDDGIVKITAFPNTHLDKMQLPECISYSFLIEGDGKRLVYSGDVGKYEDLDPVIGKGCDAMTIETGHFGIDDAYAYWSKHKIGKLYFTHNGREILNNTLAAEKKIRELFGEQAVICMDGMCINV